MKLNYKRTIKVGLAFAIIMLFWTAYDFVIPLLLERAFGLSNSLRGVVMGIDNILSLFLLPIFGKWSDNINTKRGKRTPFVFIGTILSVVIMIFVPISASRQLKDANALRSEIYRIEEVASENFSYRSSSGETYESGEAFYTMMYSAEAKSGVGYAYSDHDYLKLNDKNTLEKYLEIAKKGKTEIEKKNNKYYAYVITSESGSVATGDYAYTLGRTEITKEEYDAFKAQNEEYEKFVEPGIAVFASEEVNSKITKKHPERIGIYLAILFLVLVAMASFRSPAVALMPDVTPKPLRSQANAMINLMGGIGGAFAFVIYTVGFIISENSFIQIFAICAATMVALLVAFLFLVDENKYVEDCKKECEAHGISNDDEATEIPHHQSEKAEEGGESAPAALSAEAIAAEKKKHERAYRRSFFFILASTFMWFMGYNAISSNLSVYCTKVLNQSAAIASVISGASMAVSAIAFIPVGILAVKIGRRKSVLLGFSLAIVSFVLVFLFVKPDHMAKYLFAIFYLIAGFGLIITNVNTFPMVLELSSSSSVGKYTGYYYISTMSAQAITPFISGLVMDYFEDQYLFLYSAICVVAAFVFMFFTRYGDSKPVPAASALEYLGAGDD
ncbi:MAG: MFS transporter [Clostridia bacterium]|nr:MFS transporter [Clostridia bacterium]